MQNWGVYLQSTDSNGCFNVMPVSDDEINPTWPPLRITMNEPQSLRDCMPTSKFYANFGCLFIETKNKNRVTEQ